MTPSMRGSKAVYGFWGVLYYTEKHTPPEIKDFNPLSEGVLYSCRGDPCGRPPCATKTGDREGRPYERLP